MHKFKIYREKKSVINDFKSIIENCNNYASIILILYFAIKAKPVMGKDNVVWYITVFVVGALVGNA